MAEPKFKEAFSNAARMFKGRYLSKQPGTEFTFSFDDEDDGFKFASALYDFGAVGLFKTSRPDNRPGMLVKVTRNGERGRRNKKAIARLASLGQK